MNVTTQKRKAQAAAISGILLFSFLLGIGFIATQYRHSIHEAHLLQRLEWEGAIITYEDSGKARAADLRPTNNITKALDLAYQTSLSTVRLNDESDIDFTQLFRLNPDKFLIFVVDKPSQSPRFSHPQVSIFPSLSPSTQLVTLKVRSPYEIRDNNFVYLLNENEIDLGKGQPPISYRGLGLGSITNSGECELLVEVPVSLPTNHFMAKYSRDQAGTFSISLIAIP